MLHYYKSGAFISHVYLLKYVGVQNKMSRVKKCGERRRKISYCGARYPSAITVCRVVVTIRIWDKLIHCVIFAVRYSYLVVFMK